MECAFFLQLLGGGWTDAKMTTWVQSLENSQERLFWNRTNGLRGWLWNVLLFMQFLETRRKLSWNWRHFHLEHISLEEWFFCIWLLWAEIISEKWLFRAQTCSQTWTGHFWCPRAWASGPFRISLHWGTSPQGGRVRGVGCAPGVSHAPSGLAGTPEVQAQWVRCCSRTEFVHAPKDPGIWGRDAQLTNDARRGGLCCRDRDWGLRWGPSCPVVGTDSVLCIYCRACPLFKPWQLRGLDTAEPSDENSQDWRDVVCKCIDFKAKCFFLLWFITGCRTQFPCPSVGPCGLSILDIVFPDSQVILWPPSLPLGNHKSVLWVCLCFVDELICIEV